LQIYLPVSFPHFQSPFSLDIVCGRAEA
jgi:hypothetical protein